MAYLHPLLTLRTSEPSLARSLGSFSGLSRKQKHDIFNKARIYGAYFVGFNHCIYQNCSLSGTLFIHLRPCFPTAIDYRIKRYHVYLHCWGMHPF